MIVEGIKIAILGMGVVFVFLTLLYGTIVALTSLLQTYTTTEFQEVQQRRAIRKRTQISSEPGTQPVVAETPIVAVIAAAVATHRSKS